MSEHVILIHGDLLTKERLDAIHEARSIEDTPKHCFEFLVFIPGLFHFKMACADALWRIWIKPKEGRNDMNSLFQHVGVLRPHESGKFSTNPGFRRMHDVVHHDLWASILNCWETEASERNSSWDSLEAFAKSKPMPEMIVEMSESIVEKYIATSKTVSSANQLPAKERDWRFENQTLQNRDELLYVDLCHAMNSGDIGRVEASILPWIYMFKLTGKPKYAYQMTRFMIYMCYVYTTDLRQIIRLNWLCNPTGQAFKFCPVDWLVERNNLYTKVIFAGKGSNRTIQHIIQELPLIELYQACHVMVENGFHLQNCTIKHAPPNMVKTLEELKQEIQKCSPHKTKAGRTADYAVCNWIAAGIELLMQYKEGIKEGEGDEQGDGVFADDLIGD
ncbi:hypothetical protein DFJ58DRAFT_671175 [Suillus subalutaceus]|uniref:uncharacterized protein n=1 Tax=Suillus subalutaceus TaxID=48586 RepID=UPI001B85D2DF|nr:uncharacterized protein DFJ58DRAFT_671175 [Suillus subalutaceus]KAG1832262.1 hypothetical protein DFJ58DRAFT_671175 [Suillus subalutaceus]